MVREGGKKKRNLTAIGRGRGLGGVVSRYHSRHVVYNSIRRGLSPLPVCCPPYQRSIHTFLYSSQITLPEIFIPPPHHTQLTSYRHRPSTPHTTPRRDDPTLIYPSVPCSPPHTPPRKEPTACQSIANPKRALSAARSIITILDAVLGTCPDPLPTNSRCWWFKPHSSRQPRPHHKHITSTAYIQLVRPPHYSTITITATTATTTTTTTNTTTFIKQIITQYVHSHPRLELSNSGRFQSLLGDEEKGYNKSPRFLVVRLP